MDNRTSKAIRRDKTLLTEQLSNTMSNPDNSFYAMCDASNFGIGAALLQSHNGTNKTNLISAYSRLLKPIFFTRMRESTAIIYTLTDYKFLILGFKHPTVFLQTINQKFFYLHENQTQNIEFTDCILF